MSRRVVANLSWMTPGRVGGSEEYTTRLLATLVDPTLDRPPFDVTVAASDAVFAEHPRLAQLARHRIGAQARWRPLRILTESTTVARASRGHDLVHHFGGRLPAVRGAPAVVTIHDVQPIDHPEHFSPLKRRYMAWAIPRSVQAARLVVTPSRWVAERLLERVDLDESRLRVVPSTYAPIGSAGSDLDPRAAGWGRPLIVYPAMTHPHKDHATLIRAFVSVRARFPEAVLVLTGSPGRSHRDVEQMVASTRGVRHLGRVRPEVLAGLIEHADVMAFPSRYEGFGLPVLEAMRAGTPVVASAASALPEVVGRGGRLVEPGDVEAWSDALSTVLSAGPDPSMREAAEARVEHYSPPNARARLLAAWAAALEIG